MYIFQENCGIALLRVGMARKYIHFDGENVNFSKTDESAIVIESQSNYLSAKAQ